MLDQLRIVLSTIAAMIVVSWLLFFWLWFHISKERAKDWFIDILGGQCFILATLGMFIGFRFFPVPNRSTWNDFPYSLPAMATGISLLLCGVIGIWLRQWKHEGKEKWLIFICLVMIGPFIVAGNLCLLNGALDHSPPQTHRVVVLRKRTHQRKTGRANPISVTDWRGQLSEVRLDVELKTYNAHEVGDTVEVITSKGFFGWEWVGEVR